MRKRQSFADELQIPVTDLQKRHFAFSSVIYTASFTIMYGILAALLKAAIFGTGLNLWEIIGLGYALTALSSTLWAFRPR